MAREWLVTNGMGGYAMGTVNGAATRRYHGLLVAATRPPAERTMLLAGVEERLVVGGRRFDLGCHVWSGGGIAPDGDRSLQSFRLERGVPVWRYACGDCVLEKRIAMPFGENAVIVEYRLLPGSMPCELQLEPLVVHRMHHRLHGDRVFAARLDRASIGANDALAVHFEGPALGLDGDDRRRSLWLHAQGASIEVDPAWWRAIDLPLERARGYDDRDLALRVGVATLRLAPGERRAFAARMDAPFHGDPRVVLAAEDARRQALVERSLGRGAPAILRQLVLASEQFTVRRPILGARDGWSIIAGYPWFADWSRDAMIALPGLLVATRRIEAARGVLETAARHLEAGLLPNRWPDVGTPPQLEWNAADAPLLFIRAVSIVHEAAPDSRWLRSMWHALVEIADAYLRGTRHGIRVDPHDGLVVADARGLQLTWMDAKIGDRVVTRRAGKPVELSALWYDAMCRMREMAPRVQADPGRFARAAEETHRSFERFWNERTGCLHDVLDGEHGPDSAIRPNQIIACGLEHAPIEGERLRSVVSVVAERLLVPLGLRTLDPADAAYRGTCAGDVIARDEAYHNGTAWPWLLPFFVRAWRKVGGDPALPALLGAALVEHLADAGLGSTSEILDGDPPHAARGCPMQAWSVAAAIELVLERETTASTSDAVAARLACDAAEVHR
jgi:predicted glycogen debranching enzyme